MSTSHGQAIIKAQTRQGFDPNWASATEHARDVWPAPDRRRKCYCGCGGRATHVGGANGIALTGGCELSMRRWVRDGYQPEPRPKANPRRDPEPTDLSATRARADKETT